MPYKNKADKNANNREYMRRLRADPIKGPIRKVKDDAWWKAHPVALQAKKKRHWHKTPPAKRAANARKHHLWRTFGVTPKQWEDLFIAQGSCCAACGVASPGGNNGWHTDHCHKTSPKRPYKIRAILCSPCNSLAGLANDDITRLQIVIAYLQKHSGGPAIAIDEDRG